MVFLITKTSEEQEYILDYGEIINDKADNTALARFLKETNETSNSEYRRFWVRFRRSDYKGQYIKFNPRNVEAVLRKIESSGSFRIASHEIFSGIDVMQDFVNKKHMKQLGDNISIGDGIFVLSDEEKNKIGWNAKELRILKPYYTTREINRYYANASNRYWVIYTRPKINDDISRYPNIKKHLDKFQEVITSVNKPYGLHRTRKETIFTGPKLLSIRKCSEPSCSLVDFSCYVSRAFLVIKTTRIDLEYLLALLNSQLVHFWLLHKGKLQGNLFQIDKVPLMNVPIREAEPDDQRIVTDLVRKILSITKDDDYLDNPKKQARKAEYEGEVDQIVYGLYSLTKREIDLVENHVG